MGREDEDTDARWARKGDERHFGYKNHVEVGRKAKMVESYEVTDASVHDSQVFGELLEPATDRKAYADSAYRSAESGEMLGEMGIGNQVHERACRNRPLNARQKERNRRKSRERARVEHVFGFQTQTLGAHRLRTVGMARARRGIGLANLVYNLCRLVQLKRAMT